ncbi:MAG: protein kinase [Armatimonadetes bacterium]|nr:protein kinase [Armatimonadota bacterium]MBX3109448.1 protein kinase [Fimbriimonadaceae bacterium]
MDINSTTLLFGLIGAVVLLALGAIVWSFFGNKNSGSKAAAISVAPIPTSISDLSGKMDPRSQGIIPLSSDQCPNLQHPHGATRLTFTENLVGKPFPGLKRAVDYDLTPLVGDIGSRTHALIWFDNGKWYIKDLDSKNGTFVNERRLDPNVPLLLRHQDRISFTLKHEVSFLDTNSREDLPMVMDCEVVKLIAKGGMAAVYEGRRGGQTVALKIPIDYGEGREQANKRIENEFEVLRSLRSDRAPRAVAISRTGDDRGVLVMEYIDGGTVKGLWQEVGDRPKLRDACALCLSAAQALEELHRIGRVHCDVKPDNLMYRNRFTRGVKAPMTYAEAAETLTLIDFGITMEQLTSIKNPFGSANYQSPEHISHRQLTFKSDVYSLGCVFYEWLTGQRMFPNAASVAEIHAGHLNVSPEPVARVLSKVGEQVDPELDDLVSRMLSKSPTVRPEMAEVCETLGRVGGRVRR